MKDILFADEVYEIVGAAMEVYDAMGSGFLEPVYQECLEIEFEKRQLAFQPQQRIKLSYKDTPLKSVYIPDLIYHDKIVIELKSRKAISAEHQAQVYNYLKASKLTLGLIINFGPTPDLQY